MIFVKIFNSIAFLVHLKNYGEAVLEGFKIPVTFSVEIAIITSWNNISHLNVTYEESAHVAFWIKPSVLSIRTKRYKGWFDFLNYEHRIYTKQVSRIQVIVWYKKRYVSSFVTSMTSFSILGLWSHCKWKAFCESLSLPREDYRAIKGAKEATDKKWDEDLRDMNLIFLENTLHFPS